MNQTFSVNGLLLVALLVGLPSCSPRGSIYAPGYSEEKFAEIRTGDTSNHVIALLGVPLRVDYQNFSEQWIYAGDAGPPSGRNGMIVEKTIIPIPKVVLYFGSNGLVRSYYGNAGAPLQGKDKDSVRETLGAPTEIKTNEAAVILSYTEGKDSDSFEVRAVILNHTGSVVDKKSFYYRD